MFGKTPVSLIAGILSAAIFVAIFYLGLGFLFLFLPTLPIFWLGLRNQLYNATFAIIIATPIIDFWFGIDLAIAYAIIIALPACFIANLALLRLSNGKVVIWFPITIIFSYLMTFASLLLLAVTLYYLDVDGGFSGMVTNYMENAIATIQEEAINQKAETAWHNITENTANLAFIVIAVGFWIWGFCLYLHGWIVNRELLRQKLAIRPDMMIHLVAPPTWYIGFMIIAALASIFASPSLAFWGNASMVILLFPYFLIGVSWLHISSKTLEYRGILLFLFYFMLLALLWPAFIVAAAGLFYHITALNKRIK